MLVNVFTVIEQDAQEISVWQRERKTLIFKDQIEYVDLKAMYRLKCEMGQSMNRCCDAICRNSVIKAKYGNCHCGKRRKCDRFIHSIKVY